MANHGSRISANNASTKPTASVATFAQRIVAAAHLSRRLIIRRRFMGYVGGGPRKIDAPFLLRELTSTRSRICIRAGVMLRILKMFCLRCPLPGAIIQL